MREVSRKKVLDCGLNGRVEDAFVDGKLFLSIISECIGLVSGEYTSPSWIIWGWPGLLFASKSIRCSLTGGVVYFQVGIPQIYVHVKQDLHDVLRRPEIADGRRGLGCLAICAGALAVAR